jgi:hypothetical protein
MQGTSYVLRGGVGGRDRPTGAILNLAFSPDSCYLAYGGTDTTVRVWDVGSGVERVVLRGHTGAVEGVQFSPDGQRLASISPATMSPGTEGQERVEGRGAVKVWDLTHHPEHATLVRTSRLDVEAVAFSRSGTRLVFSPDGEWLVGTNWDESISIWQAERAGEEGEAPGEAARRRAADADRARFWHLQEAEHALEHHNSAAADFHLRRLGSAPLPRPLQQRKERLLRLLRETDRRAARKG